MSLQFGHDKLHDGQLAKPLRIFCPDSDSTEQLPESTELSRPKDIRSLYMYSN